METTQVTFCTKKKDWKNKEGKDVPIYEITLSDGTTGESFGKEIPVGTPQEGLDITEGQYGKKIKLKNAEVGSSRGFGNKRPEDKAKVPCMVLAYCKDLVIADKLKFDQMLPAADKFLAWVKSKE